MRMIKYIYLNNFIYLFICFFKVEENANIYIYSES